MYLRVDRDNMNYTYTTISNMVYSRDKFMKSTSVLDPTFPQVEKFTIMGKLSSVAKSASFLKILHDTLTGSERFSSTGNKCVCRLYQTLFIRTDGQTDRADHGLG